MFASLNPGWRDSAFFRRGVTFSQFFLEDIEEGLVVIVDGVLGEVGYRLVEGLECDVEILVAKGQVSKSVE